MYTILSTVNVGLNQRSTFRPSQEDSLRIVLVRIGVAILLWAAGVTRVASDQSTADWNAWLDARAANFSGVVLIARGDTVQVSSAFGLADRSARHRNTVETRFNLG